MHEERETLRIEELERIPALTTAAVAAARAQRTVGCLVDRVVPGRPLLLSFGYLDQQELPRFDFFGRSKKLELELGIRFNRILVRDVENAWYHRGVPGLGLDVDVVAATLRTLAAAIRPSRLVTIGQSMGAYAAILFGMLLDADRILAFGTLAHLDPAEAAAHSDLRYLPWMKSLQGDPPRQVYGDLTRLGRDLRYAGELHVIFGTHPGIDDGESSNHDAVHALRLSRLRNAILHPYPESCHKIVPWLIAHGRMDALLGALLGPVLGADRGRTLAPSGLTSRGFSETWHE